MVNNSEIAQKFEAIMASLEGGVDADTATNINEQLKELRDRLLGEEAASETTIDNPPPPEEEESH